MVLNGKNLWVILLFLFGLSTPAIGDVAKVNIDGAGIAIKGYDPVAYFTVGKPVRGESDFVAEHKGAKYAFSSKENRALFLASPDKYEPQYGGYQGCSRETD